jgi:hypothetical protein
MFRRSVLFGHERLAVDRIMENEMRATSKVSALIAEFFWAWPSLAAAQPVSPRPNRQQNFTRAS